MNMGLFCLFLSRDSTENEATKTMLLERQKEYRTAALKAKKQGDVEQAKLYIKTSKVSLRLQSSVICISVVSYRRYLLVFKVLNTEFSFLKRL